MWHLEKPRFRADDHKVGAGSDAKDDDKPCLPILTLLASGIVWNTSFFTFARKGRHFLTVGIVQKRGVGLERLEPKGCERATSKGMVVARQAAPRCGGMTRKVNAIGYARSRAKEALNCHRTRH